VPDVETQEYARERTNLGANDQLQERDSAFSMADGDLAHWGGFAEKHWNERVAEEFPYSDVAEGLANNAGQKEAVMGMIDRIVAACGANMIVDAVGSGVRGEEVCCDSTEVNILAQAQVMIAIASWGRHKAGQE
jgi:hypothetical protein